MAIFRSGNLLSMVESLSLWRKGLFIRSSPYLSIYPAATVTDTKCALIICTLDNRSYSDNLPSIYPQSIPIHQPTNSPSLRFSNLQNPFTLSPHSPVIEIICMANMVGVRGGMMMVVWRSRFYFASVREEKDATAALI